MIKIYFLFAFILLHCLSMAQLTIIRNLYEPQTGSEYLYTTSERYAQAFLTDGNSFEVERIVIKIETNHQNILPAVYSSNMSGGVGTQLFQANFVSYDAGTQFATYYAMGNTNLAANTKYWLVIKSNSNQPSFALTSSSSYNGYGHIPNVQSFAGSFDSEASWGYYDLGIMSFLFEITGDFVLPVELTGFQAFSSAKEVKLTWQTESEVNNYGFEIERAVVIDMQSANWEKIGFMSGSGNSNSVKEYSFSDVFEHPNDLRIRYRLKQIDNDGTFSYSKEVEIENNPPATFNLVQNYPNPFNPGTTINFSLPEETRVTLEIFNITGEKVATLINGEITPAGIHETYFNAYDLPSGIYFCRIKAGSNIAVKKLTLMK